MKKHDDRFEDIRFQVKRKYILKSIDLISDEGSRFVNGR